MRWIQSSTPWSLTRAKEPAFFNDANIVERRGIGVWWIAPEFHLTRPLPSSRLVVFVSGHFGIITAVGGPFGCTLKCHFRLINFQNLTMFIFRTTFQGANFHIWEFIDKIS